MEQHDRETLRRTPEQGGHPQFWQETGPFSHGPKTALHGSAVQRLLCSGSCHYPPTHTGFCAFTGMKRRLWQSQREEADRVHQRGVWLKEELQVFAQNVNKLDFFECELNLCGMLEFFVDQELFFCLIFLNCEQKIGKNGKTKMVTETVT